jgi:hypothetical protein
MIAQYAIAATRCTWRAWRSIWEDEREDAKQRVHANVILRSVLRDASACALYNQTTAHAASCAVAAHLVHRAQALLPQANNGRASAMLRVHVSAAGVMNEAGEGQVRVQGRLQ